MKGEKICIEHGGIDSDGDDLCSKYANSTKEMKRYLNPCRFKTETLVVNVKREYFEAMKAGIKTEEYRLKTPYWQKRLEGKHFDYVEVCLGYPKADDHERRLTFECKGIKTALVSHPIWANEPKFVYAIQLGDRR